MNLDTEESNPNITLNMEVGRSNDEIGLSNKSLKPDNSLLNKSNKSFKQDSSLINKSNRSNNSIVSSHKSSVKGSSLLQPSQSNKDESDVVDGQDAEQAEKMENDSEAKSSDSENSEIGDKIQLTLMNEKKAKHNIDEIYNFYEELREKFKEKGQQWEDQEFPNHESLFYVNEEKPEHIKNYTITFAAPEETTTDDPFFATDSGHNIHYEFKIKRGVVRDKFFIGAILMLFKRREEFFSNLILDYEHLKENIKAGFCGFRFFINGEWQNITVDTQLPWHQNDETALSVGESTKTNFWLTLFEKAYAKAMGSYEALNDVSIKNTLVELTGGIAKKIRINDKPDENEKKKLFEDLKRWVNQKYLLGCMRFNEGEEDLNDSRSDNDEDEDIIYNSVYVIIDVQEADGFKLVYLINYWKKGKWTKEFGQEDEAWETNKSLKQKLDYEAFPDSTFWMLYDRWLENFNTLYYCRLFPNNWSQYCLAGEWKGLTSGGAPPKNGIPIWEHGRMGIYDKRNTNVSPTARIGKQSTLSTAGNIFNFNNSPQHKKTIKDTSSKSIIGGLTSPHDFKVSLIQTPTNDELMKKTSIYQQSSNSFNHSSLMYSTSNINQANKDVKMVKEPENIKMSKELMKRVVLNDSEDRWFLNPQYKIHLKPGTRLIISLMQENEKITKKVFEKVNFVIMLSKGKYSRVWDFKEEDIIKKGIDTLDISK
jgi:hypothetical protein